MVSVSIFHLTLFGIQDRHQANDTFIFYLIRLWCSSTQLAISKYSEAIDIARHDSSVEPLADALNNRAAAHLRLENFGRALADASEVTKLVPTNIKAHYRYVLCVLQPLIIRPLVCNVQPH